jgi:hypothetical protein
VRRVEGSPKVHGRLAHVSDQGLATLEWSFPQMLPSPGPFAVHAVALLAAWLSCVACVVALAQAVPADSDAGVTVAGLTACCALTRARLAEYADRQGAQSANEFAAGCRGTTPAPCPSPDDIAPPIEMEVGADGASEPLDEWDREAPRRGAQEAEAEDEDIEDAPGNRAFYFGGNFAEAHVIVHDHPFPPPDAQEFAWSLWFRCDLSCANRALIEYATDVFRVGFGTVGGDASTDLHVNVGGGHYVLGETEDRQFEGRVWHHLVVTWAGVGAPSVFVNGTLSTDIEEKQAAHEPVPSGHLLHLGTRSPPFFDGMLDEVCYFDWTVSANHVRAVFAAGREAALGCEIPRKPAPLLALTADRNRSSGETPNSGRLEHVSLHGVRLRRVEDVVAAEAARQTALPCVVLDSRTLRGTLDCCRSLVATQVASGAAYMPGVDDPQALQNRNRLDTEDARAAAAAASAVDAALERPEVWVLAAATAVVRSGNVPGWDTEYFAWQY